MYKKFWGMGAAGVLAIACLLVFAGSVQAAEQLKLDVTPLTLTVYGNSSASFQISIRNQRIFADDFIISITGKPGWVNLENYFVRLLGQESRDVELMLSPLDTEGVYSFGIAVLSLANPDVKKTKTVYLTVLPQEDMPIIMESFDMKKAGNELEFRIGINSSVRRTIALDFTVKDSGGNLIKTDSLSQDIEGLEILAKTLGLPQGLLAGNYNVMVQVRGMNLTQMASFSIEAVRSIKSTRTIVSNPFFEEVKIILANQGNIAEEDYRVTEMFSTSLIVNFIAPPPRCVLLDTERECEWTLARIDAGEEAVIMYRIEYWPFILIWGIVVIVIILIVVGTAKKAVKPTIRKRVIKKGRGRYTIVLEIKNPFYYRLSNVMVRDWVSPLGRVKKDIKGPKPVARASEAGTELIWRLGAVKPRDEIVIHYEIKTVVHGQLKMPRAFLKYTTHKGKKDKVYSKGLVIE